MSNGPCDAMAARLLGGSSQTFFAEYWSRRPLLAEGALAGFAANYGIDDYLDDLRSVYPAPYQAVSADGHARNFSRHATLAELRDAIAGGSVAAMKLNRFWHRPDCPPRWAPFRALFGGLCRAAMMLYLSPARSEDVDLFLAGPQSQLGAHYDTTHVFTVQLFGERRWRIDTEADLDAVIAPMRDPGWTPAREIAHPGETREVVLRPGDALYVPAYAVHKVTGVTWSISLSLGLRALNEIDLVEHLLDLIRATRLADFRPLPAVPDTEADAAAAAKGEVVSRVRALLGQVEAAALGKVLCPLALPDSLAEPSREPAHPL